MNRYEVILKSITILSNHLYNQSLRASSNVSLMVNLQARLKELVDTLARPETKELESIAECCIPCSIFASESRISTGLDGTKEKLSDIDCCGILYADNDGKIKCNECEREFEVKPKG